MDFSITVVTDLEAAWVELAPLFRGLHEYHEPLTGVVLADDWEAAQRSHIQSDLDGLVLAARSSGLVIAVANAHIARSAPVFRGGAFCFVDNVYVRPEARGQGVARAMLAAIEDWCRSRDVEELRLNVAAANTLGVDVWLASGFKPISHGMSKRLESNRS